MAGHSRPKDGVALFAYVPAIHACFVKLQVKQDVDARHKAGHDNCEWGCGQRRLRTFFPRVSRRAHVSARRSETRECGAVVQYNAGSLC